MVTVNNENIKYIEHIEHNNVPTLTNEPKTEEEAIKEEQTLIPISSSTYIHTPVNKSLLKFHYADEPKQMDNEDELLPRTDEILPSALNVLPIFRNIAHDKLIIANQDRVISRENHDGDSPIIEIENPKADDNMNKRININYLSDLSKNLSNDYGKRIGKIEESR